MKCPRCQHESPPESNFCLGCGARLGLTCASCGTPLPAGSRFCNRCGTPVTAEAGVAARFTSPEAYTPKHLAEKILTSKAALEGERKQVTVLFADLKGSMEMLADRDPEEARKLLDPVLERMMEAVHRYEGTVNQVMGDGIMALFGAPLAHEDHAVRACYAALRMQESVKKYAEDVRRAQGIEVQVRVGLNSGEVVVRSLGSDLRMDYTAVGQTTHLAARMEQLATPGTIRLTSDTLRLAEGYIEVRSLGPIPVKGLADPVEVYEATGAGAVRTRLQAAARRGLSRFVGRDPELEHLRRAQALAANGRGQLVAIVGEAGVGKSRLVYEFTHSHRMQGWLVLESASVSYGKVASYFPVIDLLKGYFKIQDRDDHRDIREKVMGKLLTLDEALKPAVTALLALLDVPMEDGGWSTLEPAQRRRRTLDAVKRLLLREAREQPLLVIFEDLHWVDSETQALLDAVVDVLPSARLLLLVDYRPEYQHPWSNRTHYSQVRLDALAPERAEELLGALLGDDPALAELKQLLVKRGNPFFLEETVRTLVETKVLAGERGRYRPMQPVQTIQVPPTVQAILAARIDRLPATQKAVLQAAAVIGKDVPFTVLAAIAEEPENELRGMLAALHAGEFLYETNLFSDIEYTFTHALTHEVVYRGLLQERRRLIHVRVLDALERLLGDRAAEQAERLAEHAVRGEDWWRAARYLHLAGKKALLYGRFRDAERYLRGVIDAVEHQREPRDLNAKLDAYLELWVTVIGAGQTEGLDTLASDAEALARALGDQARLAQVRLRQAQALWVIWDDAGGLERSLDGAREAFDLATPTDLRTRSYARFLEGAALTNLGRLEEAIGAFDRGLSLFDADARQDEMVRPIRASLLAWRAEPQALLGRFSDALASALEAVRAADEAGEAPGRALTRGFLAYVALLRGDFELAERTARAGLAVSMEHDFVHGIFCHELYLACVEILHGRPQGTERLTRTLRGRDSLGAYFRTWTKHGSVTANAWLVAGDDAAAELELARALPFATRRGARAYRPLLLQLRAEMLARRTPDLSEAVACYDEALALGSELGMRPLVAHCHLGLGKLYRRTGKREQAQEHLSTATTMYREMDMRFWLEKAELEVTDSR
jgi:class 3 adenylate cyclase/tetratricopeptide (TPR) repeat protein